MTIIKKILILWTTVAVVITGIVLLFDGSKIVNYINGNYINSEMQVDSITHVSTSKRKSCIIHGNINQEYVYIGKFDDEIQAFINKLNFVENSKDISNHNAKVSVIKFKNSKQVIETHIYFDKWKKKILILCVIAYLPLLLLLILRFFKKI